MKLNKFKKAKAIHAVILPNPLRKSFSSKKANKPDRRGARRGKAIPKRPLSRWDLYVG